CMLRHRSRVTLSGEELLVLGLTAEVDHPVEVLEERQVRGEQPLDLPRGDQLERAEPLDHPREHDDRQPWVVRAVDHRVTHGLERVPGSGQARGSLAVDPALRVDVAARQDEVVGGPQGHLTRSRRSTTRVIVSSTTSVLSTMSWSVEIFDGQAA